MELIDNINSLLGDDLKQTLKPGVKLKIAASCFSIYANEALKSELESVESLQFIFSSPTFVADEVADKIRKEQREFHIPKIDRERNLHGSEFEIQLRNKLTQCQPLRVVFRDAGFKSDRLKINVEPLFKLLSPSTDVKCI